MSLKFTGSFVFLACISVLLASVASAAPARDAVAQAPQTCRVIGAISHRCYTFHSDATWPQGLPDYHGGNGG
jgi:hypothetical protein